MKDIFLSLINDCEQTNISVEGLKILFNIQELKLDVINHYFEIHSGVLIMGLYNNAQKYIFYDFKNIHVLEHYDGFFLVKGNTIVDVRGQVFDLKAPTFNDNVFCAVLYFFNERWYIDYNTYIEQPTKLKLAKLLKKLKIKI